MFVVIVSHLDDFFRILALRGMGDPLRRVFFVDFLWGPRTVARPRASKGGVERCCAHARS